MISIRKKPKLENQQANNSSLKTSRHYNLLLLRKKKVGNSEIGQRYQDISDS